MGPSGDSENKTESETKDSLSQMVDGGIGRYTNHPLNRSRSTADGYLRDRKVGYRRSGRSNRLMIRVEYCTEVCFGDSSPKN